MGARDAVPCMLDVFDKYGISATWATVGMLFARDRDEWNAYKPAVLPKYARKQDDPYQEKLGRDEANDPLHFAATLIDRIRSCPRQEIGTHTWSHYYCLDAGHSAAAFRADIRSAVAMASSRRITLRSIVFPRMQVPPDCLSIIREFGILCWRGTESSWMYQAASTAEMRSPKRRLARIVDAYLPVAGPETVKWSSIPQPGDDFNIPQSRFLRPYSTSASFLESVRLHRITSAMEHAARNGEIYHLCWHPHNFGVNLKENLQFLERILKVQRRLDAEYGFPSMTMNEVAGACAPHQARSSIDASRTASSPDMSPR